MYLYAPSIIDQGAVGAPCHFRAVLPGVCGVTLLTSSKLHCHISSLSLRVLINWSDAKALQCDFNHEGFLSQSLRSKSGLIEASG